MKRYLRGPMVLLFVLGILALSGCAGFRETEIEDAPSVAKDAFPQENEEDPSAMDIYTELSYGDVQEEINAYFNMFIGQNNKFSPNITSETRNTTGVIQSTEGSSITRYVLDGEILRYELNIYGETGRSVINYHYLENFTYIQQLWTSYGSVTFSPDYLIDLHYELNNYVLLDNGSIVIADPITQQLYFPEETEAETSFTPYPLEELNDIFDSAEPDTDE